LKDPSNPHERTGGAFTDESVRLIGYSALMQLLRMHSLLGDYHLAMQTIQHIDFHVEVPLFYQLPACHVTLYYYMGFAYLMLRRYVDAIRSFGDILAFLSKTAGVNSLSYQYDALHKKQDQMYALLLLAHALCPRPLDDAIQNTIKEKHGEKQVRLARGEELCFEELFSYACPKFVSAAAPDFENNEGFKANEAHERQLHLFLQEVKQQQFLPKIGAYMKLYTAITTAKLAQLCEMDEEALRDQLMCVMHKTRQKVRITGAPLDGQVMPCSEVEFYLDGDMVHINAHREERPHADVFLEHILKYQDLLKKMGKQ
jgi:translation initiation factor 3 subunit L